MDLRWSTASSCSFRAHKAVLFFGVFFSSSVSDGVALLLKWCDNLMQTLAPQESVKFRRHATTSNTHPEPFDFKSV